MMDDNPEDRLCRFDETSDFDAGWRALKKLVPVEKVRLFYATTREPCDWLNRMLKESDPRRET